MVHRKLQLRYLAADKTPMTVTIANPKDQLEANEVKAAAEDIRPALKTLKGRKVEIFDKASIIETTVTPIE